MAQRIDLPPLCRETLHRMLDTMDGQPPLPVPPNCPATLGELLAAPS